MELLQKQFIDTLPPHIQEKLDMIDDKAVKNQVVQNLMEKSKAFDEPNKVDIEAERNENVTVASDSKPSSLGGKLIKKSENPVSGETTYEIPNDGSSASHKQDGVDVRLEPGSVINSHKFKIDTDFKIGNKNFKGKSHKEASDYISNQEEKIQKNFNELQSKGMVDKISEESLGIMLTKLAMARKELNNRQESALNLKEQKEKANYINQNMAEFGSHIKDITKRGTLARNKAQQFLNSKIGLEPMLKAADGMNASIEKFSQFADKLKPDTSFEDFISLAHQSGMTPDLSGKTFKAPENVKLTGDLKLRANYANNFFIDKGYTPVQAAGIVGNLIQESNLNPTVTNSIGAFGIAQWFKDRKINFKTWAEQNQLNPYDMDTQLSYVDHELSTSHAAVAKQLAGANSIEEATMIVRKKYEIPGEKEANDRRRLGYANYVYGLGTANLGKRNTQKFEKGGFVKASDGLIFKDALSSATEEDKKQLSGMLKKILGDSDYNSMDFKKRKRNPEFNKMVNPLTDYFIKVFGNPNSDSERVNQLGIDSWSTPSYKPSNWNLEKNKDNIWDVVTESLLRSASRRMGSYPNTSTTPESNKSGNNGDFLYGYETPMNINQLSSDERNLAHKQLPNLSGNELVMGYNMDGSQYFRDLNSNVTKNDNPIDKDAENKAKEDAYQSESSDPASMTSIMDRIRYGLRNAAPYLNALPRMFEPLISPVLRQDEYHNPADYINTDVSVQAQLNENQRGLLTEQAQATGNPSVRNARLAQIQSNYQNVNNQLLTDKYNREQALKTQKGVSGTEYLNQWLKSNQNLGKQFEQEWLQTLENQRQQQYATADYMTNIGLRKAEEDRAMQLGLSNTVYDYDPISGKLVPNKDKIAQYNQIEKFINSNTGSSNSEKFKKIPGTNSYWYKDDKGKIKIANMDGGNEASTT